MGRFLVAMEKKDALVKKEVAAKVKVIEMQMAYRLRSDLRTEGMV